MHDDHPTCNDAYPNAILVKVPDSVRPDAVKGNSALSDSKIAQLREDGFLE